MELNNEFTVKAPIADAWKVLTDLERIAPCLPGAQLTEVEGEIYRGGVKVKVGPITAQFKGQAQFVEKDEATHSGTIKADGRDTGGKGNAAALIKAKLTEIDAATTKCEITTELTITGKVAQFGRGALADVSGKLIDQFARNLEEMVLRGDEPKTVEAAAETPADATDTPSAPVAPAGATTPPAGVRKIDSPEAKPVNLMETAGAPIAKRVAPIGAVILTFLILLRWKRRRSRR